MMPTYEFECKKCSARFEDLTAFDESGSYPAVRCPGCGSGKKARVPGVFSFSFSNPVGTARWNSDGGGHDYRFKTNIPKAKAEREAAAAASHVGATPYGDGGGESFENLFGDVE